MIESLSHEVSVMCRCDDIEHCEMERYVADVRIAFAEIERLQQASRVDSDTHARQKPHLQESPAELSRL